MTSKIPYNSYIIRYSEIALKGGNRIYFERLLMNNIRKQNSKNKILKILNPRGRIILETNKKINLKNVLGISSYSRSIKFNGTIENIKKNSLPFLEKFKKDKKLKSFRIKCQRNNKQFPMTSVEIEREIGQLFKDGSNKKVDLKNPDYTLIIEVVSKYILMSDEKIVCYSGLPVGIEGKLFGFIENKESLFASWILMKRGCEIIAVVKSYQELSLLQKFSPDKMNKIKIKEFSDLDEYSKTYKIKGIVTGYTLENLKKLDTNLIQLDPLIIWNKKDILKKLSELK